MTMKRFIPSFQFQILFLFILLLIFSVFFTRTYFYNSFQDYLSNSHEKKLEENLLKTYEDFKSHLPDSLQQEFANDLESSVRIIKNNQLEKDFFREEFKIYSNYIVGFAIFFGLVIFIISFAVISRPLRRLQEANMKLGRGQFDVRVKENPWSPLNELLVSFNKMAAEIEENRSKLIEAEKKMIWREIARAMAHEIKNPLTPIKLSLERLEMKYYQKVENFEEIFESTTSIISEEVDNLQKLVNRFRGFAAIPQPEPEKYDLLKQIKDIIEPYTDQRSIQLTIETEKPEINADKLQIKQVFTNLLQNAIHATKKDESIEVRIAKEDKFITVKIHDFGKGIDTKDLSKIFEPYFTTKRKGTGLGLAVVKQIIENHGGFITIESRVGQGTSVKVSLPL